MRYDRCQRMIKEKTNEMIFFHDLEKVKGVLLYQYNFSCRWLFQLNKFIQQWIYSCLVINESFIRGELLWNIRLVFNVLKLGLKKLLYPYNKTSFCPLRILASLLIVFPCPFLENISIPFFLLADYPFVNAGGSDFLIYLYRIYYIAKQLKKAF